MTVLLVEPWLGGSHQQWAEGLVAASRHRVHVVGHEAKHWRWRMRGASLTLAEAVEEHIEVHGQPDVLLISEMVDVAALVGFCKRLLVSVPVVVYFHENQLTYRTDAGHSRTDGPAVVNWLSAAVADEVWFNSEFHKQSFFGALGEFLASKPDQTHTHRLASVEAVSSVVPVGVDLVELSEARGRRVAPGTERAGRPARVLWNQRWDHDKAPEQFFRVLRRLAADGLDFVVDIAGENRRKDPREFSRFVADWPERVVEHGYISRAMYVDLLGQSDVVVSTALQEFFGIAMIEAVVAGAVPLLPHRLSYPEIIPTWAHPAVLYSDQTVGSSEVAEQSLKQRLAEVIGDLTGAIAAVQGLPEELEQFDWKAVGPLYDDRFERLAHRP